MIQRRKLSVRELMRERSLHDHRRGRNHWRCQCDSRLDRRHHSESDGEFERPIDHSQQRSNQPSTHQPWTLQPTTGLILSNIALQTLQTAAASLSLLSYSSIDLYGSGQIGSPAFLSLALHAAEIRGFNNNGSIVRFDAKSITLDNGPGNSTPGPIATPAGTLSFNAGTILLGANQLKIDQLRVCN